MPRLPRAVTRYRWLFLVAVVAAALAVIVLMSGPEGPAPEPDQPVPADASADGLVADACGYLTGDLRGDVDRDAPAPDVLERVGLAERRAREAAARDPRWVALAGGAGALLEALEQDDPRAASLAMRVITANCPDPSPAATQ